MIKVVVVAMIIVKDGGCDDDRGGCDDSNR